MLVDPEETQVEADQVHYDDEEISLLNLASSVLRRRQLILVVTCASVLFALISALRTPLEYTATTSFLSHGGGEAGIGGVASLAQEFGLSVPRSVGAERSPEFYVSLLTSREILDGLINSGVEVVTNASETTVDLAEYFGIEGVPPEEQSELLRRILATGVISSVIEGRTGVITVSVLTDEAGLSAAIAQKLLDLIAAFDIETRQSQASAERRFAEERLSELQAEIVVAEDSLKIFMLENRQFSNSPQLTFEYDRLGRQVNMRQELVTAMAQAYEQARVDEVRNIPVITVIDQPEPPALPNGRGRLRKLWLGLIMGIALGFGLAFILEFGERVKTEERRAYSEFLEVLKEVKRDLFGFRRSRRLNPRPPDSHG